MKTFGPVHALKGVSIKISSGDIRGLIGENGSGKSTLSAIIAGILRKDSGSMMLYGEPYDPQNVLSAQKAGVGMVVQEMGTVSGVTVSQNLFIGKESLFTKCGIVSIRKMRAEAKKFFEGLGLGYIDPSRIIDCYNAEDRKLIEIARALYSDPDLLIIDETSSALSHKGRDLLYKIMNEFAANDKAVLFISHDLDEIMQHCSSITVLRDGELIADVEHGEWDAVQLKRLMVGRNIEGDYYRADFDGSHEDKVVLSFENVTDNFVKDINFSLYRGEILGISGLSESGIHNIGRLAFGIDRQISGHIYVDCKDRVESPRKSIKQKMGYVSKNRDTESLVLDDSIRNNLVSPVYDRLIKKGFILPSLEKNYAQKQIDFLDIKCTDMEQIVQTLSGGNKQKVVFGRWIGANSEILILDCPTRGIDIGVKTVMYQLMYKMKKEGKSILLISEELPELLGMCDRILVIKDGRITKEFNRHKDLNEQSIIEYMI